MDNIHEKQRFFDRVYPNSSSSQIGKSLCKPNDTLEYNPLYGEISSYGVHHLFHSIQTLRDKKTRVRAEPIRSFADLGCGIGKVVMLAFLFYPDLNDIYGIELSRERFDYVKKAIVSLYEWLSHLDSQVLCICDKDQIFLTHASRKITIVYGNLHKVAPIHCDLYLGDFAFVSSSSRDKQIAHFIDFMKSTKPGTLFVTYERLQDYIPASKLQQDFVLVPFPNVSTTWGMCSFAVYQHLSSTQKEVGKQTCCL